MTIRRQNWDESNENRVRSYGLQKFGSESGTLVTSCKIVFILKISWNVGYSLISAERLSAYDEWFNFVEFIFLFKPSVYYELSVVECKEHFPRGSPLAHTVGAVKSILVVVLGGSGVRRAGSQECNMVWGPPFSFTAPPSTRWILQLLIVLDQCRESVQTSRLLVIPVHDPFTWLDLSRASAPFPRHPATTPTTLSYLFLRLSSFSEFVVEICCLYCKFLCQYLNNLV